MKLLKTSECRFWSGHSFQLIWLLGLMPGESHGRRSLVGYSPWGREELDDWVTSLSLFTFMHWRRKWQPTPVFLTEEYQGQRSLVGCRLLGHTESDTTDATAAAAWYEYVWCCKKLINCLPKWLYHFTLKPIMTVNCCCSTSFSAFGVFSLYLGDFDHPNRYIVIPSLLAQLVKNPPAIHSWVRKICWRRDKLPTPVFLSFPCGSAGKESTCNAGDLGLIPGLGRSPGEGKGYPLQYSGLDNSIDCTWGLKESHMTEWLSLSLVVLIYISFITYDVKHLRICLFSTCISSLMRCLLKSLAHFFYWRVFLCILDNYPLSDMSFENIFSKTVTCLFILFPLS